MSLALKNVVKRVGAETHIYETSIELKEEAFNVLLGATQFCCSDHFHGFCDLLRAFDAAYAPFYVA